MKALCSHSGTAQCNRLNVYLLLMGGPYFMPWSFCQAILSQSQRNALACGMKETKGGRESMKPVVVLKGEKQALVVTFLLLLKFIFLHTVICQRAVLPQGNNGVKDFSNFQEMPTLPMEEREAWRYKNC